MKLRRFLSSLLFGVGCAVLFIGLLATVLPMIQNDQLRLVLSSFEMPSENLFVSAVNSVMTYALRNCYLVMLMGAVAIFAGVMLMLANRSATRAEEAQAASRSPYAVAADDTPVDVPVWRASRAPEVAPKNPFADPAISELLTPGTAKQPAQSNPFAAFAPAAKPKAAMPVASVRAVADTETLLEAYKPPVRAASAATSVDSAAAVPAATAATAASSAEVTPVSLAAEASPASAVVPVAQPFAAAAPVVEAPAIPQVAAPVVPVAPVADVLSGASAAPVAPVAPIAPVAAAATATDVSTAAQPSVPAMQVAAAPVIPQVAAPVVPASPVAAVEPVAAAATATDVSTAAQVSVPVADAAIVSPVEASGASVAPVAPATAASDVAQLFATVTPVAPIAPVTPAIPQPEVPAVAAFPSVQGVTEGEGAPKPGASQSGSRIVIRSTFTEAQAAAAASAEPAAPAVQPQPEAAPRPMQPAAKAPGSRIKSTMGKHS